MFNNVPPKKRTGGGGGGAGKKATVLRTNRGHTHVGGVSTTPPGEKRERGVNFPNPGKGVDLMGKTAPTQKKEKKKTNPPNFLVGIRWGRNQKGIWKRGKRTKVTSKEGVENPLC